MVTRNARLAAKAQALAEAAAAKDRELLENLQKRDAAPPKPTLMDNFVSVTSMLAQAKKETHLTENTLIKTWELVLMWEINNRNQPQPQPVFDPADLVDVGGDGGPTTADEMIGESPTLAGAEAEAEATSEINWSDLDNKETPDGN